jgi:uncharacterized glyoxalase superfamily protein PhnB
VTGVRYLSPVSPSFQYEDAKAAIEWLQRAFGFEPRLVVPGEDGQIVHSEIWAGGSSFSVASASAKDSLRRITPAQAGGAVTSLCYAVVDDVDAHYERAKAAGAEILMPPTDEDYGGRDYVCRDPGGYIWSFGTYAPDPAAGNG